MNLKFFLLGLCVLVSIAQVKTNAIQDELNGKPDQFKQMELHLRDKRNLITDLFENSDETEDLDRVKRQEAKTPPPKIPPKNEAPKTDRRFNPMEAIGSLAQKPAQMALKQAMAKIFASYKDTSKPFGPTYDTTWGSPPPNRKMNGEDRPTDEIRMSSMMQTSLNDGRVPPMAPPPPREEVRMSTMIQPPPGYPGYHSYETQKMPSYYSQSYGHKYENIGHPWESYQHHYDANIDGKQRVFSGPPPGYFPYKTPEHISTSSHQYFQQNRRTNAENLEKRILEAIRQSPQKEEEIKNFLEQMQKNKKPQDVDDISMRNGFLGDVFDKNSEEKGSGEVYSNTQVEFSGPQAAPNGPQDSPIGNRRFSGNDGSQENMDKLLTSTFKNLGVICGHLRDILENGTPEQIGERFVHFYDVLKSINPK